MKDDELRRALEAIGRKLAEAGLNGPVEVVLVGGAAGLLQGLLRPERSTTDCDVMDVQPESDWAIIERAVREIGEARQLGPMWLNRECQHYAYKLPPGWRARSEVLADFGPLRVRVLSRIDLIASKACQTHKRPQDLQDILDMRPTEEELRAAEGNLRRLQQEVPDPEWDKPMEIIRGLRNAPS